MTTCISAIYGVLIPRAALYDWAKSYRPNAALCEKLLTIANKPASAGVSYYDSDDELDDEALDIVMDMDLGSLKVYKYPYPDPYSKDVVLGVLCYECVISLDDEDEDLKQIVLLEQIASQIRTSLLALPIINRDKVPESLQKWSPAMHIVIDCPLEDE